MARELALDVLGQLGTAAGAQAPGARVHDPLAGTSPMGAASLGTPGQADAGARLTVGVPLGAAVGPDGGLHGGDLLRMGWMPRDAARATLVLPCGTGKTRVTGRTTQGWSTNRPLYLPVSHLPPLLGLGLVRQLLTFVFSEQRDGSCSSSRRESDAARGVPSPAAHR